MASTQQPSTQQPTLKPLAISCTSTDCDQDLHCFLQKKKRGETRRRPGPCRACDADLVEWKRVQSRKLADVKYTFDALSKEQIRHEFWHRPFDEVAINHARRKGRVRLREAIGKRLRSSVGKAENPREGAGDYQEVLRANDDARDFFRLFLAPGILHCGGGPGPNSFGQSLAQARPLSQAPEHDILSALERWVEEGVAPERIVAVKYVNDQPAQGIARTRPLCAYPKTAVYKGRGSTDDAASFQCRKPKHEEDEGNGDD